MIFLSAASAKIWSGVDKLRAERAAWRAVRGRFYSAIKLDLLTPSCPVNPSEIPQAAVYLLPASKFKP